MKKRNDWQIQKLNKYIYSRQQENESEDGRNANYRDE